MHDSIEAHPPRQVPSRTVDKARSFAARCADFLDLVDRPPWSEPAPGAPGGLYTRIGHSLPGSALLVNGVVRSAVRFGFAGAWLSYDELAVLVGRNARTCRRSIELLCALELITKVPEFCDATARGPAALAGYTKQRLRNAYALGPAALSVRKAVARVWPGPGASAPRPTERQSDQSDHGSSDKTPDKMSRLLPDLRSPLRIPSEGILQLRSPISGTSDTTNPIRRRPAPTLEPLEAFRARIEQVAQQAQQAQHAQQKEPDRSVAAAPCGKAQRSQRAEEGTRAGSGPLRVSLADREACRVVAAMCLEELEGRPRNAPGAAASGPTLSDLARAREAARRLGSS